MNVQMKAYQMLLSALGSTGDVEEPVFRGLQQYLDDNGLEEILSDCESEAELQDFLSIFLEPIFSMSKNQLLIYLANYRLCADFESLSMQILDAAVRKYRHPDETCEDYEALSDRLAELATQIYSQPELRRELQQDIPECVMDLSFIAGETDKTSIRLKYRV